MTVDSNTKVFVCLPAYGQQVISTTVSSLMATQRALDANGLFGGFGTLSYPDIVEIRNIFVSMFYDTVKCSHMLFVDADMGWAPELILDMIRLDKPLVGALCPKKKLPIEFAGRAKPGDARVVNGFMEVNGIGGAIMLISREVVTAMLAKWPELSDDITIKNHAAKAILDGQNVKRLIKVFNKLHINGEEFSEDLSFCHRWNQCGGEIWANITHEVSHVGLYEYKGAYYNTIKDHIRPLEPAAVSLPSLPELSVMSAEVTGAAISVSKLNGAGVAA